MNKSLNVRNKYLVTGVIAMLLAGVIYAWSILKAPLGEEFGWGAADLALNFTMTMCCFCLGGFIGGKFAGRIGVRLALIMGGVCAGCGFMATSMLKGSLAHLYLAYGVLAGLGIGICYVVIISTISAWFPDKKGLCSGFLMMGFGASTLIIGKFASAAMDALGWRSIYMALGILLLIVLIMTGMIIRLPDGNVMLPDSKKKTSSNESAKDFTTREMMRRSSFWRAFICIVFLAAVGNTVISFAKDLAISLGAADSLSTSLVGLLSIANGLGRIITGIIFDKMGRKKSMVIANLVTIAAAVMLLVSVSTGSLVIGVAGLFVTGLSYGACPTFTSVVTSSFYGTKHFSSNFSVMNFNLMFASLIASLANVILESSSGYTAPFILLVILSVIALALNVSIRRP